MELKLADLQGKDITDSLSNILTLNNTRIIKDPEDNDIGILWNLSRENLAFEDLDKHLAKLDHSSRGSGEHPCVVVSERRLEMVSFPMDGHIKSSAALINRALHAQTNMIGHVDLLKRRVR